MTLGGTIMLTHLSILFLDFHSSTLSYTTTAFYCWLQSNSPCTLTASRYYFTTSSIIPHRLKAASPQPPTRSVLSAAQASEGGGRFISKWCGVVFCSSTSYPPNDKWCTWVWIQHHLWRLKKYIYRSCNYRMTLNFHEFLARMHQVNLDTGTSIKRRKQSVWVICHNWLFIWQFTTILKKQREKKGRSTTH